MFSYSLQHSMQADYVISYFVLLVYVAVCTPRRKSHRFEGGRFKLKILTPGTWVARFCWFKIGREVKLASSVQWTVRHQTIYQAYQAFVDCRPGEALKTDAEGASQPKDLFERVQLGTNALGKNGLAQMLELH